MAEDDLLDRLREFCASHAQNLQGLSHHACVPIDEVTKYVIDGLEIADIDVYALARALGTLAPSVRPAVQPDLVVRVLPAA